jgi:hypothetical protein
VLISVLTSVARILVDTENPGVCNGGLENVQISDNAVLITIKREFVTELLINPITRTRTRQFRHAYHPTHDDINESQ